MTTFNTAPATGTIVKVIATTAFMFGKLNDLPNKWSVEGSMRSAFDDLRRDIKLGEPIVLLHHATTKDWRWVALRNITL